MLHLSTDRTLDTKRWQMMIRRKTGKRHGFTILEVLIALAAALLMMLGLARAYKLLGDKITERQSEMDLSLRLRDVAIRLRDELRRATCDMRPPARVEGAEGYLVYYEGPFTDSTTLLGSVPHPTPSTITYFPDSRVGDIDDFLAFTTRAQEGAPFLGFIPRGVLDAKRFMDGQMTTAEINLYDTSLNPQAPTHATELVPFYSEVAEVAYWLSPEWVRNTDGSLVYDQSVPDGAGNYTLHPVYLDRNEDLLPDKMNLHRRTLLVRPDLNVTPAEMNIANGGGIPTPTPPEWNVPTVPFLLPQNGGPDVAPISNLNGTMPALFPQGTFVQAPGLWENASATNEQLTASPHWMTGIARLQQIMDLSLSRVTDSWSVPETNAANFGTYGMPTAILKANSLADLTRPENRFAHVRIPHRIISGSPGSSMPQIALSPPHPYLIARESSPADMIDPSDPLAAGATCPTTFPHQADAVIGAAPGATRYLSRYGRFTMKAFVRPEYNLADRVSDFGAGGTGIASVNRGGSDVIAKDVVGFDVQVYDPNAPRFVWVGNDGLPGVANFDDDGDHNPPTNPALDELDELGWPDTDDELVTVNNPRLNEVFINNGNRTVGDWNDLTPRLPFFQVDSGDFVDLGYARLAGGPMGGLIQFDESGNVISPAINTARSREFLSNFSGFAADTETVIEGLGTGPAYRSTFPVSWEASGRLIVRTNSGSGLVSSFFQPVYDTWTNSYDTDAFDQEGGGFGSTVVPNYAVEIAGVTTTTPPFIERRSSQFTTANNSPAVTSAPRNSVIRRWTSFSTSFGNTGQFSDQSAGNQQTVNQGSTTVIPVSPPVPEPLRAIKISIRLNDLSAETIRQQTVIQEF